MDECLALADLGASINLMPLSVWNKISLPELSPTCMTLKLTDRSISRPVRVAVDVFVKVGTFHFPADFVVVNFDADPQVLLILERTFLKTWHALIDVYEGELTLRVGKEAVTFNLDQTSRYSEVLGFFVSETDAFLAIDDEPISPEIDNSYYDSEGDILLLEEFLNDDPSSPPLPPQKLKLKVVEPTNEKSSIDEPPVVKLKDLPPHLEYAFLEGNDRLPVIIAKDLKDEEKTALIKFNAKEGLIQKSMRTCLSHLDKMLKLCKDTNLCLNWEKSHFMVKEGIFLGHKISKNGIEVDKAKVDVIAKIHHPITVKGSFSSSRGNKYILVAVDYLSKWVEAKALPTIDARVVCKILKSLFARFRTYCAIISDHGMYFFNYQFTKVMLKYGVTHRLASTYHSQTSGQVEVSNRGLKRILERIVGENRASWSDKLDDALWAFRTAFKGPIGCTPYKLGKVQLNELNELRDQAYENSLIYKEKTKRIHDSKIKDHVFNVGDRVLRFNSRLKIFSGKLKTRWTGPFTITQVFPYGTVELSQTDGPNFKVNGHRLNNYFGEDIPKLVVPDLQTFPKDQ
nr:reverse transcriptase domain-containing protein [Tanacetum cinerariifolium]